jgi:hypothetical protein
VLDIAESVGTAFTQAGGELSVVYSSKHDRTVRRNAFVFFQFREITLKDTFLHP